MPPGTAYSIDGVVLVYLGWKGRMGGKVYRMALTAEAWKDCSILSVAEVLRRGYQPTIDGPRDRVAEEIPVAYHAAKGFENFVLPVGKGIELKTPNGTVIGVALRGSPVRVRFGLDAPKSIELWFHSTEECLERGWLGNPIRRTPPRE